MNTADTVYNYEPYDVRPADYITPPNSWEGYLTDLAHAAVTMTRPDVRKLIKPIIPTSAPGMMSMQGRQPNIMDVLNLPRPYVSISADTNFAGFRGTAAGYSAASRNTMGNGQGV